MQHRSFFLLLILGWLWNGGVSVFAQDNISALIDQYYELSDAKKYKEAAEKAIEIGEAYERADKMPFAKKFYEFAVNDSYRAENTALYATANYKDGMAGIQYASGAPSSKKRDLLINATKSLNRAHQYFEKSSLNGTQQHVQTLLNLGLTFYNLEEYNSAVTPLETALEYAQRKNNKAVSMRSAEVLSKIGSLLDKQDKAEYYQSIYQSYQEFDKAVDSLKMTKQTNENQKQIIAKKEEELEERNLALENAKIKAERDALMLEQRQNLIKYISIVGGVIFIFLIVSYRAYRFTKKAKRQLEAQNKEIIRQKSLLEKRQKELSAEKAKSEKLLLNILPRPVAAELREKGRTKPKYYDQVTVMFTDFKGFTKFAEKMDPPEIIKELDACFMAFDNIIEKYNLEKIKTMGDGYMCAGGLPEKNRTNPIDAVKAAIEMQAYMHKRREEKHREGKDYFELRIGIHTGPVIAGVVGRKKFAYDIWGDTVNVASRMESSGVEGKINVSGDTFVHVKDTFFLSHRGKIKAKNKGEIDMFFVEGKVKYAVKRA